MTPLSTACVLAERTAYPSHPRRSAAACSECLSWLREEIPGVSLVDAGIATLNGAVCASKMIIHRQRITTSRHPRALCLIP